MSGFKDCSIKTKLTLLAVVAAGTALLLSSVAFVLQDVRSTRAKLVEEVTTLAQVVGSTSTAALSFDDAKTATELLSALRLEPSIESACLYDHQDRPFATYVRQGSQDDFPPRPPALGYAFGRQYLEVVQAIVHNGEHLGTFYLRGDTEAIYREVANFLGIAVVVMAISFGAAMLLSFRMQRAIAIPVLDLAQTAQRISQEGDYSLRVQRAGNDELGTLFDEFNAMLDQIEAAKKEVQKAHNQLEHRVEERTRELFDANQDLSREIAERTRAEHDLADAQQQVIETAPRAGMAEIATGVLHNVGNVLNSVNVSAGLVVERLRHSKLEHLCKSTELIEQNQQNLASFFTDDPKGKMLPGFLKLLATHLAEDRSQMILEIELLSSKIDHIKTIVATQQSYAGVSGMIESVDIATALEDALKLNEASLEKHEVHLTREFGNVPKLRLDKHRLIQILVNIVKNAKDAMSEAPGGRRELTLRTFVRDERAIIELIDTGIGIAPENLTRIFSHGFTTKQTGHGFGLHSCANAAREMHGSLTATSDGPGRGATFTLEFPIEAAAETHSPPLPALDPSVLATNPLEPFTGSV